MPYKRTPQSFSAAINSVTLGTGSEATILGGENTLPFYTFDSPITNSPKIGIEIVDEDFYTGYPKLEESYAGCADIGEIAKKAAAVEGADFICLRFEGADPNGANRSPEDCAVLAKKVADAVNKPIVIMGSKNAEKDVLVFDKVAGALEGKNALFLSAKEENYKTVGASVGLAYAQKVGAESAVDINLAKQLNVLMTQLGVKDQEIVMNVGSAAAGYGFEYVISTIDRIKMAALSQNDKMLQMPIVTPVASETWTVKESIVSETDFPDWGPVEERAIEMEIVTAAACLSSGSDAVIVRHPVSVTTLAGLVNALM
jgi:acetyl-CoA decarbonylase/synthase complex subunit delta